MPDRRDDPDISAARHLSKPNEPTPNPSTPIYLKTARRLLEIDGVKVARPLGVPIGYWSPALDTTSPCGLVVSHGGSAPVDTGNPATARGKEAIPFGGLLNLAGWQQGTAH